MTPTIRQVAEVAGTSIATVSRALNNPHLVRADTRERIEAAITTLGFRPNLLGRQLRGSQTRLIGVVLPTLINPVFAECLQGIEEAAARAGYRTLVMTTGYQAEREERALDTLLAQRVDGLILTVAQAADHAYLDRLDREGVPYRLVYNQCPQRPCVSVDNRQAAREGVELLLAQGHQCLRMISGPLAASDRAAQRYAGFQDALLARGISPPPPIEIAFTATHLPPGLMESLLAGPDRPTALFCGNDLLALTVIRALTSLGWQVPRDISLLGFDGLPVGELLNPMLASVSQPNRDIGRIAWECLGSVLMAPAPLSPDIARRPALLPHGLRPGQSIAPPAP